MAAIRLFDPDLGFQRLERYELIGEIASGGMATVFLARLRGVGGFRRFFAIKCLLPHLARQSDFVEMFLDEARLAAAIRHPNVVPILEVGTSDTGHFLVMEYVEGESLAGLIEHGIAARTQIPVSIALRIAIDMLMGLHAAHELRDEHGVPLHLVHRDVSPQNVLIGSDGIARISDFGVARATSRLSSTREGELKGKLAYMAPEYILGERFIDRRADIFAVGIVVWEMLTLNRLFKGDNEAETLARVVAAKSPRLQDVTSRVSAGISAVVTRALARDPSQRYATCAEFAEALETSARGDVRLASSRELAVFVCGALGASIVNQRERVRLCIERLEKLTAPGCGTIVRSSLHPLSNQWSTRAVTGPNLTCHDLATTKSILPLSRPRHTVFVAAALAVLGFGGAIGAYMGVRETNDLRTAVDIAASQETNDLRTEVDIAASRLPIQAADALTQGTAPSPPVGDATTSPERASNQLGISRDASTLRPATPRVHRPIATKRAPSRLTHKKVSQSSPVLPTPQNPYR